MARALRRTQGNECRMCSTFCDRVIDPGSCIEAGCVFLYEYEDPATERRFMGCLQKVFAPEIDVELFRAAQRTRAGFGTVKLSGEPLRRCAFQVERAYEGAPAASGCVNRRFFDAPDSGPDALRAFDLRQDERPG
jgi:hypothetical protein